MPFPLQRTPVALLGAFDLKTTGQNPTGFGEVVTPVVDVYDQYRPLSAIIASGTITGPATAVLLPLIVPNGFAWRVVSLSIEATIAVGDVALESQFQATIGLGGGNFSYIPPTGMVAGWTGSAGDRIASTYFDRRLFLSGGQRFNCAVILSAAPAAPVACDARVIVQEIPV